MVIFSFVFFRCVEYLLRNDADPAVRDKQGYTAVHYASAYGRTLCLELVCTATVCTVACSTFKSSPHMLKGCGTVEKILERYT